MSPKDGDSRNDPRRRPEPGNGSGKLGVGPVASARLAASADIDQTFADSDQTVSDADQTSSDADRAQAESDQRSSNRDQAAADRDAGEGPGGEESEQAHAASRADREQSTRERGLASISRLRIAGDRDEHAARRDRTSAHRDLQAEARDRVAAELDSQAEVLAQGSGEDAVRLREALVAASRVRMNAAESRARAAVDRRRAAEDRLAAAQDRHRATVELQRAHLDALTGAYRRALGEAAIENEMARAERADGQVVLAFADVDGLKTVNDRHGHAAGDAVLRKVAATIQEGLRSYDPLVRFGGDEFVCALVDTDLESAERRFAEIQDSLDGVSITVGLSEMRSGDSVATLIARSDTEMRRARGTTGD
jgi:diguanylate cyclase (GGDEF)-like protein